jgi:hypothetical protein
MAALTRLLIRPWGPARGWVDETRSGRGVGLSRLALAALLLGLALSLLGQRQLGRWLEEAPGLVEQLPRLGLRGGSLWTDPPETGPRILRDSRGRPVLLLDLDGKSRLEEVDATVQLTRTRILVKDRLGVVQAFPLAGTGQPDGEILPADLLAFLLGPARWLAFAFSLPLLTLLSLALLFVQQALLSLMALVPDRLYGTGLDMPARLRLVSLAILGSSQLTALLLLVAPTGLSVAHPAGLPPWLLPLVLSLAGVMRGITALHAAGAGATSAGPEDGGSSG